MRSFLLLLSFLVSAVAVAAGCPMAAKKQQDTTILHTAAGSISATQTRTLKMIQQIVADEQQNHRELQGVDLSFDSICGYIAGMYVWVNECMDGCIDAPLS